MSDPPRSETVHGSAVAVGDAGVLIRGGAGAGKSTLALELIEDRIAAARLVADDRVVLTDRGGVPTMAAPAALRGLIEVRGVGIVPMPNAAEAPLSLVVDLLPEAQCRRMPDDTDGFVELLGRRTRRLTVPIGDRSAALRVRVALRAWGRS